MGGPAQVQGEPVGGGVVEEVGFVAVAVVLGGGQVQRGFAGQGPGAQGGGV